ncbi:MAG: sugar phosphate nucleotidyltransferase, partial [Deltaproteobacteria bacterium]|nr:sugar phosphate nucleotidyltransferase [Deltaproteobacteria bacterium]
MIGELRWMTICLIIMGTIDMDVGVLLAGGVGSRFWPLSKKNRPKQFMCNFNGKTFLKCAYERLEKVFGSKPHAQLVVTNEKYVDLINTDLPDVLILPENKSRNTAPAIAFAVAKALTMGANRMIVVPADHAFEREEIMVNALKKALDFVEKVPLLVVFGAKPLYPHTGYGYIKVGGSVDVEKFGEIKFVRRFFEKPSLERAKLYVNSGEYLWNMGIFVWSVEAVLKAFEDELPDYHEVILKIADLMSKGNGNFEDFNYELEKLEPFSIDIGLIERVRNIA